MAVVAVAVAIIQTYLGYWAVAEEEVRAVQIPYKLQVVLEQPTKGLAVEAATTMVEFISQVVVVAVLAWQEPTAQQQVLEQRVLAATV